ncbi:MAG: biopolymer transport protein ExbD [Flavobacterium sp.]|jgi:biopolymer transport protein ExbD
MAKVKAQKKAGSTDMTAMCDVAFLLLTFFILTATAKVPSPITVDTPSSTNKTKLEADKLVTITVGTGDQNVFFDIKNRGVREKMLELMADKYGQKFTDEEKQQFLFMESFGVPVEGLAQLVKMKTAQRNEPGVQTGIPFDSINNQLSDWIYAARQANVELNPDGEELIFALKGDAKLQYPKIQKIMDILQDNKVNTFDLVTGLRDKNY